MKGGKKARKKGAEGDIDTFLHDELNFHSFQAPVLFFKRVSFVGWEG